MEKNMAKSSRNLCKIVEEMLEEIPTDQENFISSLKDNLSSVSYSAPEAIGFWWNQVYTTLQYYIPDKPIEEWHFKVMSIFSAKTVDDLKEEYKKIL
jgi:hypothetical protein